MSHLKAIVAVDANWGIGYQDKLLFSLPSDMKFFRQTTLGHTVAMGRKTLDSFPNGNPLPKRRNVVLTHQETLPQDVDIVHSLEALVAAVAEEETFVIGGGTVYEALLSQCETVFVTKVQSVAEQVDTYFPKLDDAPNWKLTAESEPITENGHTYTFCTYQQVSPF